MIQVWLRVEGKAEVCQGCAAQGAFGCRVEKTIEFLDGFGDIWVWGAGFKASSVPQTPNPEP